MSFRPVGSALHALLEEWLQNDESRRVVMERTWQRAVGEKVSRRCRPLRLQESVLTVEVTDSSWAPQLQAMSRELIGKINATLGKDWVRRIDWVDGAGQTVSPARRD